MERQFKVVVSANEVRRFALSEPVITLDVFCSKVSELTLTTNFKLKWNDDEGDAILVKTEDEFQIALSFMKDSIPKFYVEASEESALHCNYCQECKKNFDLCSNCEAQNHGFTRFSRPVDEVQRFRRLLPLPDFKLKSDISPHQINKNIGHLLKNCHRAVNDAFWGSMRAHPSVLDVDVQTDSPEVQKMPTKETVSESKKDSTTHEKSLDPDLDDDDGEWDKVSLENPGNDDTTNEKEASQSSVHADPRVEIARKAMMDMGFSDNSGYLTKLLEDKKGDIGQTLDAINNLSYLCD